MSAKTIVLLAGSLVLLGTSAMAASRFDACMQEEQRLRATEKSDCSGMSYILNPSACFITRKQLAPYDKGKCREFARQEGVPRPAAAGEQKAAAVAAVTPQPANPVQSVVPEPLPPAVTGTKVAPQTDIELLRGEVAELKRELQRLKEEVARLRGLQ